MKIKLMECKKLNNNPPWVNIKHAYYQYHTIQPIYYRYYAKAQQQYKFKQNNLYGIISIMEWFQKSNAKMPRSENS